MSVGIGSQDLARSRWGLIRNAPFALSVEVAFLGLAIPTPRKLNFVDMRTLLANGPRGETLKFDPPRARYFLLIRQCV